MKRILIIIASLMCGANVFAGLSITPSRTEISMAPGTVFVSTVSVYSDYDSTVTVNVSFSNWNIAAENGSIKPEDWVTLSTSSFLIGTGETVKVPYTVHPSSGLSGSLCGMLTFNPVVAGMEGVSFLISTGFYVTLAGTEVMDWNIGDIAFKPSEGAIDVSIKNNGNVYVRPTGYLDIISKKRDQSVRLPFYEDRPVYPKTTRSLRMGNGSPVKLEPGKYTGEVVATYRDREQRKKIKFKILRGNETVIVK